MLNQEQIQGKWTEIKGGIRNLWGEITDAELEQLKGNIHAVSGIVQTKYGESKESIKEKMDSLMDSFDNETDKSLKLNDGESSYQRSPIDVQTSGKSQNQDTISDVSTRSSERRVFEQSEGGSINAKQGIAGNRDNQSASGSNRSGLSAGTGADDAQDSAIHDIDTDEIFDDGIKAEDRIARH